MDRKADVKGGNCNVIFDLEKKTARKFLRNDSSKEKILRFKQELEVLNNINLLGIPNIVKVENVFINEENIKDSYVEMKLYDGSLYDLFDITKANVKLSFQLILPIIKALYSLTQIATPIYHRDIKPDNILYLKEKDNISLYLTDFGICFLQDEHVRLTPQEIAIGPRMFIAPEYEIGRVENIDEKGDIFSLGKVLWCMINGEKDEFLPSNYWFVPEYDLAKRFPDSPDMVAANVIIASCLQSTSKNRCDYPTLIAEIEGIIGDEILARNDERKLKVIQFQEKRNMELLEIKEKNKLLVNRFSQCYVSALEGLITEYESFELLQALVDGYKAKSRDGIEYTTTNVENNSAHYLYSTTYDRIYISINYNPAHGQEKFCNISISYSISSGIGNTFHIYYSENSSMLCKYGDKTELLSAATISDMINVIIEDYIKDE